MITGYDLTLCDYRLREAGQFPKRTLPGVKKGENLRLEVMMYKLSILPKATYLRLTGVGTATLDKPGCPGCSTHPALPNP